MEKSMDKYTFIGRVLEISQKMPNKQLAEIMECSEGAVSKMLNPNSDTLPNINYLIKLAQHFNVSVDWLTGLTDQKGGNAEISTYADMFRHIEKLVSAYSFFGDWHISYNDTNKDCPTAEIWNTDKTIANFFANWGKMVELVQDGTIDRDLYELWLQNKIKRYENEPLCPQAE